MTALIVNGTAHPVSADPEKPLLWVLREDFGLTGTKFGCGAGLCGACTVLVDDKPVRSCQLRWGDLAGARVTTVEGVWSDAQLARIAASWMANQVPQCGYCQPGMIMAACGLLLEKPQPTDADIDAAITNLCRCGTYPRVRRAVHAAAGG
ncbi:(2Fe-2S)-binding protein [Indioceanicola profundi]|uniref:(2Fe-2S)-binding protein n=1 Tax=Indioceanicola profundi TaxID=2220096 RepID=UPI000E6AD0BE|nr:(2Fe-2S)-binding protein [Indioceanicola profundi]